MAVSLYQPISHLEFETARCTDLAPDYFEREKGVIGSEWKIRHFLPVTAESYCALVTLWKAYIEGRGGWLPMREEPFDTISEAYAFLGLPAPERLALDGWHADFKMIEQAKILSPLARTVLDRFSGAANWIFVRCHHGKDTHNWTIDRALFLELADPFVEMPIPFGIFTIFPAGVPWFMHSKDDEPVIYLAGRSDMVRALEETLPGRVIGLTLEDRYY